MKVILLRDVPKIGRKYEVKDLSEGYARNFLFPRKLAEPATPERIAAHDAKQSKDAQRRGEERAALKSAIESLDGVTVAVAAKADERGHLFKKMRAADVMRIVREQHGADIPLECFVLQEPVTATGEHAVPLSYDGASAKFTLLVTKS